MIEYKEYKKKPVVIKAFQFTKEIAEMEFALLPAYFRLFVDDGWAVYDHLHDSWIKFEIGAWIAEGTKGEHYPIEEEIFPTIYDKV